ncbi:MAG: polysaccharide deacetylase family protein, partial [Terriglobia bacterium]
VAVTPLLERYGQKAIVFITTDFIDPSGELRPTIKESPSPVKWQGYLSIPELRAMAASGHIEIQSHAMTHTWEFVSPEIVDFYGPHLTMDQVGCDYRFLWLNRNRALKPFALQHLRREAVAWGTPVYRFAPALVARRYRPDPDIETKLVETVAREGGKEFFRRTDWRAHLERLVEDHRRRFGDRGSYETEEERRARICNELHGSRTFLEQLIGQPVRFLAPPQGGSNEETLILARKCGYDLVTAPGTAGVRLNHPGAGRGWVHRCSTGYNLFGRRASLSTSLRSQRIVLARYSGEAMAMAITKAVGAYRRLRGAGKRARQLTASGE